MTDNETSSAKNEPCQLWKDLQKYGEKVCSRKHAEALKLSGYPQGVSCFYYDKDENNEWKSYIRPKYAISDSKHRVDAPTIDEMVLYIARRLENSQIEEKKQEIANILAQATWTILRNKLLP